jgi:hypothetical protein
MKRTYGAQKPTCSFTTNELPLWGKTYQLSVNAFSIHENKEDAIMRLYNKQSKYQLRLRLTLPAHWPAKFVSEVRSNRKDAKFPIPSHLAMK